MAQTYTTIQGDMWDSVAYKAMGSSEYTDAIMRLNQQYLDYYLFPAGIVLNLPPVGTAPTYTERMPPWKKVDA